MIRNLLVSILFFIGPALLMMLARNLLLALLRRRQPEVIDVTPVSENEKRRVPRWFYLMVIVISLISSVVVFSQLQESREAEKQQYIPAHVNGSGVLVPGHWK